MRPAGLPCGGLLGDTCVVPPPPHSPAGATSVSAPRHIPELDGIRGLAALAVIFHHLCNATIPLELSTDWAPSIRVIWHVTQWWTAGVDLFFVLSGFLISSILLQNRGSSRYYQDFYWKRVLRILPLYAVCLGIWYAVNRNLAYAALAAAFMVNFASVLHVQGMSPFWTLSIEEQFYLVWPTVVRRKTVRPGASCGASPWR